MKLLTRDTDYAVRALTSIAGSKDVMFTVSDLAEKLDIPRPFLRKILQILNKRGLLKSYKGKGGGFSLVVDPNKINIFALIETFQGPFTLCEHVFKGKTCPNIKTCYLKDKLDDIEESLVKSLRSITVKSMVR